MRYLLLFVLAAGCERSDSAPAPRRPDPVLLDERAALLPAMQVDSLTLTPIVAHGPAEPDEDLMTLDEAFAQKLVAIKELPSETVNTLTLTNNASRPLFLLAGEVIIGGKQDRIIGQNTIIAENTTQTVPVFCVEHGRWNGDSEEFASGKALAHGRLRGNASFEGQSEVWSEVATKNRARRTMNSTDTYRQVATQQTNGTLAALEMRVNAALMRVRQPDRDRMIGYIASINGKVATIDRFNSPTLFRKLESKLVRSYLIEAVDTPAAPNITPPTVAAIKTFIAEPEAAPAEDAYETDRAETIRYKSAKAAKASVELKKQKLGKGKSKPVYETYQAK